MLLWPSAYNPREYPKMTEISKYLGSLYDELAKLQAEAKISAGAMSDASLA